MFSALVSDQLVPQDHHIHHIKLIASQTYLELYPLFSLMHDEVGWPYIRLENLLKASLLIDLPPHYRPTAVRISPVFSTCTSEAALYR